MAAVRPITGVYLGPPLEYAQGYDERLARLHRFAVQRQADNLQDPDAAPVDLTTATHDADRATSEALAILGGDPEAFYQSRINPSTLPGTSGYNKNQTLNNPRLAVARSLGGGVVAYGYAMDNVSGTPFERTVKRALRRLPYVNLRELFVAKNAPEGTAQALGALMVQDRHPEQPVSMFAFKGLEEEQATTLGLDATGNTQEQDFGGSIGKREVVEFRGVAGAVLQAAETNPTSSAVLQHMRNMQIR